MIESTKLSVGSIDTELCTNINPCKLIIDTGTSIITGPSKSVRKVLGNEVGVIISSRFNFC